MSYFQATYRSDSEREFEFDSFLETEVALILGLNLAAFETCCSKERNRICILSFPLHPSTLIYEASVASSPGLASFVDIFP